MTVKLLREAILNNNVIEIEGTPLVPHSLASVIGKVVSFQTKNDLAELEVDDCTGIMMVKGIIGTMDQLQ